LTRRGEPFSLLGPAGRLEAELHRPQNDRSFRAVVAHPHPLYGGTMDNGVVMLITRALVAAGGETLRFNFRGVGGSDGDYDEGRGERLDLAAAIAALSVGAPALPLLVAGYSFGAVMTLEWSSAGEGANADAPAAVLLVAPPVTHYRDRAWSLGAIPSVVLYGERDELTPPALLEETASRWGSAVRTAMVPGVSHDLGSFGAPRVLEAALEDAVKSLTATFAAQA
jgi:alpha/beta superfamily hydrolase